MTGVPTAPTERTRLGVVGWPVAHSRSPAMHNAALAAVGLVDWRYSLLPIPPELVEETLRALPGAGFHGVNVTIPHKAAALNIADVATARAQAIGAANTLLYGEDGTIAADNTDAPALVTTLATLLRPQADSALVLGAGGSARAAVWALRDAGVTQISVWNRTPQRARELAAEFGARAVAQAAPADVLVNCTSLGLDGGDPFSDAGPGGLPVRHADLRGFGIVVDYVYAAGGSRLLDAARDHGAVTVDGLALLVAQGALSFEQFTHRPAPRAVMDDAARSRE